MTDDAGEPETHDPDMAHALWATAEAARRRRIWGRVVLATIAVALASAGAYLVYRLTRPGPNYSLPATTACLRARGYTVSRVYRIEHYPAIDISGQGWNEPLPAVFTSSPSAARRVENAEVDSEPSPPRRNVAFIWEGLVRDRLFACLRSR